jgi:hypothetical protein
MSKDTHLTWRHVVFAAATVVASSIAEGAALTKPILIAPGTNVSRELEYQVKAAFLYNFLKYVQWPNQALAVGEPIRICILGADPFGQILDRTIANRTVEQHPLEVRRISRPGNSIYVCHLAFMSHAETHRYPDWFAAIGEKPILTVGEEPDFINAGGAIEFVLIEDKVRFDINEQALTRAGVSLSSRIMALARRIQ